MSFSASSSDDLLGRVRRDLALRGVLDGIETVVTACSGGGDSVALLDLMARIGGEAGIEVAVAHVDHGVRGEHARRDAERVRVLAADRGLPMYEERVAVAGGDRPSEASLRRARLEAFRRIAESSGAGAFALGHTRDDRAETLLLNAARGSGLAGLGALRWRRRHGELLLVRPLLGVSRERLRRYCRERGLHWHEDETNADDRYARNRLRNVVLPELERTVPGAGKALARLADLAAREEDFLDELARQALEAMLVPEELEGGMALDVEGLEKMHEGLRARVLRLSLRRVRGDLRGLSREHVVAALQVLEGAEVARDVPGVRVRRQAHRLRLLPLENRRLAGVAAAERQADKS